MQLTELIATQQKLKSERDVAIQQCKMAEDRAGRMEKQLQELKILHSEYHCMHACILLQCVVSQLVRVSIHAQAVFADMHDARRKAAIDAWLVCHSPLRRELVICGHIA